MRDDLVFYLNGTRLQIRGEAAFAPLSDFLRDDRRLVGTKVGCGEGDCGACTVLIGRLEEDGGSLRYRTAASCLQALHQLDGTHVVTVEGLKGKTGEGDDLHPVQRAMIDHHGSQCGFCTPGFVVALAGLFEDGPAVDERRLGVGLAGNLCRCTGYVPILVAARAAGRAGVPSLSSLYPSREMIEDLRAHSGRPILLEYATSRTFFRPVRLDEALRFKARHAGAVVLSGGTELGVERTRLGREPSHLLSLAGLPALGRIAREGEVLSVGATATWTKLEEFTRGTIPILHEMALRFATPQIRNVATLAGNIAQGSPVADSLCVLTVTGAEVELASVRGTRRVRIDAFYRGGRLNVLAADEIITRVLIPLPTPDELVRMYKVTKRKEMDVSTFRAAFRVARRGDVIERATIAYSGLGPTVSRLRGVESFLAGRPFVEATFHEAGRRARVEVEPLDDGRAGRDFRLRLARNLPVKFFLDATGTDTDARRQEVGVEGS